ncbi:MAG: hypothetical protein PHQ35_10625 [Phycisphaerae bacterium]|nr:hypothetical protein [Phycisphaerae bacterium]
MNKNKEIDFSLDLFKLIVEKRNKLEEVIGENIFLNDIEDRLGDFILDLFGFPQDNTTDYSCEEQQEFGQKNKWPAEFFCRDWHSDILYDFGNGEISKEKLIKEFNEELLREKSIRRKRV